MSKKSKKSKKQYARAGVIQSFLGSNRDILCASFWLVVYPAEFLHRVRAYPNGKLVSVEYIYSREVGFLQMSAEDFMANKSLPSNTRFVRLKFSPCGSLHGGMFLVEASFRNGLTQIIGNMEAIIDLIGWFNVPFSDFVPAPPFDPAPCDI